MSVEPHFCEKKKPEAEIQLQWNRKNYMTYPFLMSWQWINKCFQRQSCVIHLKVSAIYIKSNIFLRDLPRYFSPRNLSSHGPTLSLLWLQDRISIYSRILLSYCIFKTLQIKQTDNKKKKLPIPIFKVSQIL